MPSKDKEIKDRLAREERTKKVIQAAWADKKLMADLQEALRLEEAGEQGEPWEEVKARLGIV